MDKPIIEVSMDQWRATYPLTHFWPTPTGPGKCLATWQRGADGLLYAECAHYKYVVKE